MKMWKPQAETETYHTEAFLAPLLWKVSSPNQQRYIATSKPCCPICADILRELHVDFEQRHDTISAFHLPHWVPEDVYNGEKVYDAIPFSSASKVGARREQKKVCLVKG